MKNLFILFFYCLFTFHFSFSYSQSCIVDYSYSGTNENVTFINLSTVQNAHYFWNFGDGSGSIEENPIHKFPESGDYLVTLYALDTINNCSNAFNEWLAIESSLSDDDCQLYFRDTIYTDSTNWVFLKLYDISTSGCNNEYITFDDGASANIPLNWNPFSMGPGGHMIPLHFIGRLKAYHQSALRREYFRTIPHNFSYQKNYQSCSANFEFLTEYTDSGALVRFAAMSRNAEEYTWAIIGFGNSIFYYTKNFSFLYPYSNWDKRWLYQVWLDISDSLGCRDTLNQVIRIDNPYYLMGSDEAIQIHGLNVFPNPTSDQVIIQAPSLHNAEIITIAIINIFGKIVYQQKVIWSDHIALDVKTFMAGMYMIYLQNEKQELATKFVKQ
ncbi:MAG TPA: T9SS type A sorting domain-containing protein [Chitinophagales bacterium]|nr:T9SS type A sorting domain-containing protein [Chitinophagales bacterium]